MRQVQWWFEDGRTDRVYPGFTDDTRWNGWLNVCVTPETRDKIVADLRVDYGEDYETAADIASLPIDKDGLVSLGSCYTAQEFDPGEYAASIGRGRVD
jgi:hypothetical protein